MRLLSMGVLCISVVLLAFGSAARPSNAELKKQVAAVERAFAATMKARDHAAFTGFLSDEAVFFSGPNGVLRGREAVAGAWRKYYDGAQAPFSWEPEEVEVVDSGTLAYSGGPVYDASGKRIGRFNSIWRLEAPGRWRVVFDRGEQPCNCKPKVNTP
ncbi:YybH family protein [Massilia sp. LXY-6]|uniref:YybH family protein n=1 Tax=Massilia sp. LXY-6 TaxID=3379823 RepID=UPI003EDF66E3